MKLSRCAKSGAFGRMRRSVNQFEVLSGTAAHKSTLDRIASSSEQKAAMSH